MVVGPFRAIGLIALSMTVLLVFAPPVFAHGDGSTGAAPVIPASSANGGLVSPWNAGLWLTTAAALSGAAFCLYFLRRRTRSTGSRPKFLPLLALCLLGLSSTPILMLAGDSSTAAAPQAVKSVTYQSDFAQGYATGWFIQPGTSPSGTSYLVADGGADVFGASANNGGSILVFYNGGEDWKNVSMTATLKLINGSVFYLNFRDQMTVANHSRYALQFDLGGGALRLLKTLQVGANPVTTTTLGSPANYALSLNVWYTVGITADGGALSVNINGSPVLSFTDPNPLLFGTIGVENDDVHGAFRIGSVSVTSTIPPQATWQQLGGPDGGQIQAIDIDPTNTSVIYAGAVHTGVMKSDNKGDFWREIGFSGGMTGTKANIVAIAPSNSSVVYASLEDSSTGGGASKSTDGGLHWRPLSQGLTGYFVETLAVDPTNPNTLYIATENLVGSTLPVGLEKSMDGGNTWTTLLSAQVQSITISRSNPSTLCVGTADQGVMHSDNGGATWKSVTPAQAQDQQFNRVVIDPQNPNIAIAHEGVLNLGGRTCGPLFRTTDGGNTWTFLSATMPLFGEQPCSPEGGLIDLAQAQNSPSTLYAVGNYPNGTGLMLRSDDTGGTWRTLPGRMAAVPQVVKIDPTDANTVYVGTFGEGVYRTEDGGVTLTHLTTGFLGGGIYALAVYPGNSNVIYASRSINGQGETANGLGTLTKSVDGGVTWTDHAGPPFNIVYIAIDPVTPSTMYVATSGSLGSGTGLWKSTDGGNTWAQKNQGLTYLNLTTIAINPSNTNMLLVGTGHRPYGGTVGGGIFKSTDGGNTWHKAGIPDYAVDSIAINPSSTNIMYAATFGGGVYKSTDSGETWSQSNSGIGNNDVYVLAINPQQPDTLYAGINPFYADPTGPETNLALFKTTNGGASWKNILLDTDVEWIMLDPANPNNVYEGNHGGYISWSLDGGATWSYGTDMIRKIGGHAYMWGSTVDPTVDALLVGTCGRGVFINHLATGETTTPIWLKLQYNGAPYNAIFASNSTLPDFRFDAASGSLTFTVSGPAATRAVSNVTLPTGLLTGPFTVTLNGSPLAPLSTTTVTSKGVTEIVVRYTQNGNNQRLVVTGVLPTTTTASTTTTTSSSTKSSATTTSATRTATTTSQTSATSFSSSASTTSSPTSTTTFASSSTVLTTPSTTSTAPSTSSSSTAITQTTTQSNAQSGGGGIPEFPVQLGLAFLLTVVIVASYALTRRPMAQRP